jgi:hypothetical protein
MAKPDPTMQPRQFEDQSGWYILIVWPNGVEQQMDDFPTEADARDWIDHESVAWLADVKRHR